VTNLSEKGGEKGKEKEKKKRTDRNDSRAKDLFLKTFVMALIISTALKSSSCNFTPVRLQRIGFGTSMR